MSRHVPGRCPVCGALGNSCTSPHAERIYVIRTRIDENALRFRSRVEVTRPLPGGREGQMEVLYSVGHPIPLLEAIRQGQVKPGDLTAEDKDALRVHVRAGVVSIEQLRGWL